MDIRVGYNPQMPSVSERYPVTPDLPELQFAVEAAHLVYGGHQGDDWLDRMREHALQRRGHWHADHGIGIVYPSDLWEFARHRAINLGYRPWLPWIEWVSIPEGHIKLFELWGLPDGREYDISEATYLEIVRQVLIHHGRAGDAQDIRRLQDWLLEG